MTTRTHPTRFINTVFAIAAAVILNGGCMPGFCVHREYAQDLDGDGHFSATARLLCEDDADGMVLATSVPLTDCDDGNAAINPEASEVCNGRDDDCDGGIDAVDADQDGFGLCEDDCDDSNAAINPGAQEACDGLDTDCNGALPQDEADSDADNQAACAGDCDDSDPRIHAGAKKVWGIRTDCLDQCTAAGDTFDVEEVTVSRVLLPQGEVPVAARFLADGSLALVTDQRIYTYKPGDLPFDGGTYSTANAIVAEVPDVTDVAALGEGVAVRTDSGAAHVVVGSDISTTVTPRHGEVINSVLVLEGDEGDVLILGTNQAARRVPPHLVDVWVDHPDITELVALDAVAVAAISGQEAWLSTASHRLYTFATDDEGAVVVTSFTGAGGEVRAPAGARLLAGSDLVEVPDVIGGGPFDVVEVAPFTHNSGAAPVGFATACDFAGLALDKDGLIEIYDAAEQLNSDASAQSQLVGAGPLLTSTTLGITPILVLGTDDGFRVVYVP